MTLVIKCDVNKGINLLLEILRGTGTGITPLNDQENDQNLPDNRIGKKCFQRIFWNYLSAFLTY